MFIKHKEISSDPVQISCYLEILIISLMGVPVVRKSNPNKITSSDDKFNPIQPPTRRVRAWSVLLDVT